MIAFIYYLFFGVGGEEGGALDVFSLSISDWLFVVILKVQTLVVFCLQSTKRALIRERDSNEYPKGGVP